MKRLVLLILACLSCGVLTPLVANATQSQLSQTINPIQCTYTVFTTGTVTLTPTQCSSQLVPTLSSVTTTLQPRLIGTFSAIHTSSLRVFVGENWFTLGISSALTTSGDTWTLDLANTSVILAPSTTYTVIVETVTPDGYVLSSVYQDILRTQANPLTTNSSNSATQPQPLTRATTPIDLIAPFSQSGISQAPRYYDMSPSSTTNHTIDDIRPPGHHLGSYWIIIFIVILIGIIILVILAILRRLNPDWRRRRDR